MLKTKQQIKDIAIALFLKKGIESVSGYDIALKAKVRYSFFEDFYPDKLDLIIDIYKGAEASLYQHVYGDLDQEGDFKKVMNEVFKRSVQWSLQNQNEHDFMQYIQSQPYLWNKDNAMYPTIYPPILEKIKHAVDTGLLAKHPIDFTIHFIMTMFNTCVSYIISVKKEGSNEHEALIEPMFESCWNALKK